MVLKYCYLKILIKKYKFVILTRKTISNIESKYKLLLSRIVYQKA